MATDYKTLRVPAEQYEAAKAQKEANNRTWGQQVVRPDGGDETAVDVDAEALAAEVAGHLNGFEWHIDTSQVSAEVVADMDYDALAGKTAKELEGRLR